MNSRSWGMAFDRSHEMFCYLFSGDARRERHAIDRQNDITTLKIGMAREAGESIYYDYSRLTLRCGLIGADYAVRDTDCALSFVAVLRAYHLSDRVVSGSIEQPVILFGKLGVGVELGDLIQITLIVGKQLPGGLLTHPVIVAG